MKFTLGWLRAHLDTDASLARITDTLSAIGLEVEGVSDPGAALAAFRVAMVVSAAPHPNADRLRVCRVDAGEGVVEVVCGAPNARAGMRAVFAPPGSVIPATGAVLRVGEIRGVASNGMLLSRREMGLGEEHDGIEELAADAPVGASYAAHAGLDDPVIEIAVTPNRGDALAVRGVARDLAAAGLGRLKPWAAPAIAVADAQDASGAADISWRNEFPEACAWVTGRLVRGVRNGASPDWLRARLTAIGLRPISALVDITNYMAIDLGRPLHVFDARRIAGGVLTVRRGRDGESLRGLDGRDHALGSEDCVIADAAGVVSVAGVIGGAASGCDGDTTDVFIECALFDPVRIALTGRRLGVTSDARQRFERGIDPSLLPAGLAAATGLVLELCGGRAGGVVAAGAEPPWRRVASLDFARLAGVAGVDDIGADEAVGILERLGFAAVERDAAGVTVQVPPWRNDVAARRVLHPAPGLDAARLAVAAEGCDVIEPQVDLIEEVLRIRGLDRIRPVSLPVSGTVPAASLSPRQLRAAVARRVLAARGLLEAVTFSFTDHAMAGMFGGMAAPRVANPIAADLDTMRPTPLATLAPAARRNAARGWPEAALFEIGPGFSDASRQGQRTIAACLRAGPATRHWQGAARAADVFDAKADAMAVLAALGVPMESLSVTTEVPGHYHPGQAGSIRQGPRLELARFGALHPAVLRALDLPAAVACEVMLDAIAEPKRRKRAAPELASLMPVRRDFAFAAGPEVAAEAVLRAARGAERGLIVAASLFDVFALPDGRVSLGVEVVLQPRERTLTDAELEAVAAKVVAAVGKATGAVLR